VPTSLSIVVLILAQSAATSRAYAAKYEDSFDEDVDLIGLAGANIAAGFSSTFVVNGSPTKTQMVDSAGGRSQIAQLTAGGIVLLVLVFLTTPITYMPKAVLASVVFIIGIELVDYRVMDRIRRVRFDEFVVAALTALTVVVVGVEQGIILAIVASMVDHLRQSYRPNNLVLVVEPDHGEIHAQPVAYDTRTAPGLVVYRFDASLYYANSRQLLSDITAFIADADTRKAELAWFCLDAAAIADVDYTAAQEIRQAHALLDQHHARLVFTEVLDAVRAELDRYGVTDVLGTDAFFASVPDVIAAFEKRGS
jgi:MFS superfamily sulfate permease-like transporter